MIKVGIFRNSIILSIIINLNAEFVVRSYRELRNQGIIRQSYEESCGAASMATLINNLDFNNISEQDVLEQIKDKNNILILTW